MFVKLISLMICIVICLYAPAQLAAAELYDEQELFAEPRKGAKSMGRAEKGDVLVVERRGYWVQLKAGDIVGWTQLEHVKMDETIQWMAPIDVLRDTGRMGKKR